MRAFVAIPLQAAFSSWLEDYRRTIDSLDATVRLVSATSCHMTLRFLGEVSRDRVDEMGRLLSRSLSGTFQFQIVLDQTGTFNRKGRPSVLWLGPSRIPADLVNLAAKVDRALAGFGSSSRVDRFTPHVTLGRFATGDGIPTIEATLEDVVPVAFLVKVTSVVLFESVLGQGCPLYIPRASVALCDLPNRETELY